MVKGISRQVIVVRSPDPKLFEQAIFILRENALGKDGMSDRAILRQAQQAAGSYVPSGKQRRHLFAKRPTVGCWRRVGHRFVVDIDCGFVRLLLDVIQAGYPDISSKYESLHLWD